MVVVESVCLVRLVFGVCGLSEGGFVFLCCCFVNGAVLGYYHEDFAPTGG